MLEAAEKDGIHEQWGEVLMDAFVYHLYNLTYDEVLIIDPETPITREQYKSFES